MTTLTIIKRWWGLGLVALLAVMAAGLVMWAPSVFAHVAPTYVIGDVFAGVGAGKVEWYEPNGTLHATLNTTSLSLEETGMCFDAAGNLRTTNWTAGSMSLFDNTGALTAASWAGPFSVHPESCVVNGAGSIYVGEVDGLNRLQKFNAAGATIGGPWSPAIQNRGVDWIDLAADQCTILYTSEGNLVKAFDVCAGGGVGAQLPDFTPAPLPSSPCYALRIRPNGEVMVACSANLYRLNAAGAVVDTYTPIGIMSFVFAMNLDPDGVTFWTGDFSTGDIWRINMATHTGEAAKVFTAPPQVFSMAGLAVFGELTVGGGTVTCTQGFWKNHTEAWTHLTPTDIPAWGGGNTYLQILQTAPKNGNASVMLAHAYIAAKLNTGANAADLVAAEALLALHPIGSNDLVAKKNANPDRAPAITLAGTLQTFNESLDCTLP